MMFSGHNAQLFSWKKRAKSKSTEKTHMKNDDIDRWRKRLLYLKSFRKKPHSEISGLTVALQSSDQLKDHDEAYSEAQALLGDWVNSTSWMELESEEEDDLIVSLKSRRPVALTSSQPTTQQYDNFNDLYKCLAEQEEHTAVDSFLQNLMEQEVLDFGMMEQLSVNVQQTISKFRNPIITMEARQQQVRENRARQEAKRERQQREREAQLAAREEAKRRETEREMRKKQEARRQEELMQQEMVRLRRQMEERRALEQLNRQREREQGERQRAARNLPSTPTLPTKQEQQKTEQLYKEQKIQTMVQMSNLKCLQRHFSGWYLVMLNQRLQMGKVLAICDWKRQLRAWRAWRTLVLATQKQREVARTEKDLQDENRRCQLAAESDRRRLLRRCLNEWHLWCRMEQEQRELLAQQQKTQHKMAALINAVSTGKLKAAGTNVSQPVIAPQKTRNLPEMAWEEGDKRSSTLSPDTSALNLDQTSVITVTHPNQPWRVKQKHVARPPAEVHMALQKGEGGGFRCSKRPTLSGGRFENRHAAQQQIIAQQRKLLKEQQGQIARLKEEQSMIGLELEMEKTTQLAKLLVQNGSRPNSHSVNLTGSEVRSLHYSKICRADCVTGEPDSLHTPPRKAVIYQTSPHPAITAMEVRARQRAERKKEIEELKKKKEQAKLAELKAAEEQRLREEEEEKHKAAEKKREEKRLEKEKEEERQKQQKRQQELLKLACEHYRIILLLRRGLAPWKRLIQLRQANTQLAESHHNLFLLRRCTLGWQQSASKSVSEKEASADQLHRRFLLQRSLNCWKRLKDWRMNQEEQARHFHRCYTLRRFLLALLDHATEQKLVEWDQLELAQEHNKRRLLKQCFLAWTQIPCLQRKEREREGRREKLGRKVAKVLADFCTNPL
ncbi:hypothetical protein Q5P01_004113 [Channa striata]|uniref:Coiled-coil domain containing 191 n=1 Tax=Channa striata TaxID=64152 RepID=A0AA88NM57_CHASR|nr:hypothetical protein Q5P01_004113 [Channa striata]